MLCGKPKQILIKSPRCVTQFIYIADEETNRLEVFACHGRDRQGARNTLSPEKCEFDEAVLAVVVVAAVG